uniref:Uncharacterized protein n=1 Tax=viral metagenome TaxID=1070528 RepID=A0A6C0AEY8_9ZZZZ
MFEPNKIISYVLELSEDVDFFDIILALQIKLRTIFKYYNKTIELVTFSTRNECNRLKKTNLYKKYNDDYLFSKDNITYFYLLKILKRRDEYKSEKIIIFNNIGEDIEYSLEEFHILLNEKKEEFENLFVKEIVFTEDEKKFIYEISNHELLKGKIKGFNWTEKITCD